MPKLKTRKSAAKRFRKTGTGKFMHNRAGGRHLMRKKNAKRRRRLRQATGTSDGDTRRLVAALPYA